MIEIDESRQEQKDLYRITRLKWAKDDKTVLILNDTYQVSKIPEQAHRYTISGRSALDWAVDSYRHKGTDDPNSWYAWQDDSLEFVRHLKRLCYLSIETVKTIDRLPPSLETAHV